MPVFVLLTIAAQNDGLRIFLLILVLVAVVLILAAGVIAILTFYRMRQASMSDAEEPGGE